MKKITVLLTIVTITAITTLSGCISVKKDTVSPAATTTTVSTPAVQRTTTYY